jgi:nitrilase
MSATKHLVAIVQHPPAMYDRAETLRRAVGWVDEAAKAGAGLIVFPETFVPGYPDWVWRVPPENYKLNAAVFSHLLAGSIDLASDDLKPLQDAAARHSATIVCGIDERNGAYSGTTLYNTIVTIGQDGSILNRHRKLMPTNPERMVWGIGDGSGLRVVDTPSGRVGGLICWENYMPLARYALYAQGVHIYVATTWDQGDGWLATMRHIALEGRCWVLGSGSAIRFSDVPADFPFRDEIYADVKEKWMNSGDSVVVNPFGEIVAGPMHEAQGVLYAECDPAKAIAARRTLDTAGHYSRPDVFELKINREAPGPAAFVGNGFATTRKA